MVHSFLLLNKCGAYALPHQPHHHPHMQSSCLNVCISVCASGFSVCVFYVCVCSCFSLSVAVIWSQVRREISLKSVLGKAKSGGKLKCCFFPLSSLASLSFSNYAAGSVPAIRKSRGNPFAMQIVTKKAVALKPSGSRSSG